MATEEELREARKANARDALGETSTAWFPNWLRPSPQQEARRARFVRDANDPATVAGWPGEEGVDDSGPPVPLYGRLMAMRGPFLVIQTPHGRAQAYFPKELAKSLKPTLKRTDIGDHVYVEGWPMRTNKGDGAVRATLLRHVSKALLPPPEKWHGLKDVEKRYRERYVDLFANPDVADVFRARSRIVQSLRAFLDERGFLEVETPLLHSVRGGAIARPFETHHNTLDLELFLRIAPELYLKRLLVGGFDRVYEIGRCFRNEGISTRHNPEFTILEFYMAYASYAELMDLTVELFRAVDAAFLERWPSLSDGRPWTLAEDFARVPMRRAIVERVERAGRDGVSETPFSRVLTEATVYDPERLEAACRTLMPELSPVVQKQLGGCDNHGERIYVLYELLAEPELPSLYRSKDGTQSRPVFVTEHPFEVSPLARKSDEDPAFVDRFELFVEGREIVNAFSELNDPEDQAERFLAQVASRQKGDQDAMDYDADYIRALSYGMPPAAGFGLGVDRLTMLLCNQPSIRDVLLFPLLRPEAG